jgi:hypothetical protein
MTKPHQADRLLKLGDLSRITNIPKSTLAQRFDRGIFKLSRRDKASRGSGEHKEFCRDTITGISIAQKLIELGVGVTPANKAASLVCQSQPGRAAGETFEFGRAILIHTSTGTTIKNLDSDSSIADVLGRPMTPAVILDIGPVIEQINLKLKEETKRK